MGLMRLPRFNMYEGGAPGGIGGVGTSGPGSAAGVGDGGDGSDGMGQGGALAGGFTGNTDFGGEAGNPGSVIGTIAGLLGFVATGSITASVAFGQLVSRGVNKVAASNAISSVQAGVSPKSAMNGIVSDMGGPERFENSLRNPTPGEKDAYADPKSDSFWDAFVKEWQGAKESLQNQQKFRREQLQPAFDTYKQRLAGMSNEPGFKPITVGMGDFKTSFMPKRATQNAQSILGSQLSEADIMDPEKANLSYLDRLQTMGQFQKQIEARIDISDKSNRLPDDQGTWLDAAADIMKVGSAGADIYDKLFG
jgi:hypothetical protein